MTLVLFFTLGLMFGSFSSALVWRLHKGLDFVHGRSMCPHCWHQLSGFDLVPLLSWIMLRGRCRYCKKPVSWQYPLIEVVSGLTFAASFAYWPRVLGSANEWVLFGLWLVSVVFFISLTIYDLRWLLLPDKLIWPLALTAITGLAIKSSIEGTTVVSSALVGVVATFGFFYLLALISNGRWIGGGDVKFGLIMGLWLGAIKAVVAMLLAFYSAAIFVLPLLMLGKITRKSQIPFGPFLIAGTFVSMLFGAELIDWYKSFLFI